MFKVTENGDGSTSIFCNKTGELLFKINDHSKKSFGRCSGNAACVIEPSLQLDSRDYEIDLRSGTESDDEDKDQNERQSVSPVFSDSDDEYSEDCIAPDEFARCLNLVPTDKFRNEPLDQLKTVFPLRKISRTKGLMMKSDAKLLDDVPLNSCLGRKILQLNAEKNFYNDELVILKVKHYEHLCRNEPVNVNLPKLRFREKREYPVCVSQKILKVDSSHLYSFNRKQRLERLVTIETGLSPRSRKLLKMCNKKSSVKLRRLKEDVIASWLSRSKSNCISVRLDEAISNCSDSDATVIDENSFQCAHKICPTNELSSTSRSTIDRWKINNLNFEGAICDSRSILKKRRFDCSVKLNDVLHEIREFRGNYYVNGTNILIPFFSDFSNGFHCPKSTKNTPEKLNSPKYHNCLKNKSLNQMDLKKNISTVKEIPVIDLTDDSAPNSKDVQHGDLSVPECSITNYVFRCYACNMKKMYNKKSELMATIHEHFNRSHCAKNLQSNLKSYFNSNTLCRTLVAFPAFRRS